MRGSSRQVPPIAKTTLRRGRIVFACLSLGLLAGLLASFFALQSKLESNRRAERSAARQQLTVWLNAAKRVSEHCDQKRQDEREAVRDTLTTAAQAAARSAHTFLQDKLATARRIAERPPASVSHTSTHSLVDRLFGFTDLSATRTRPPPQKPWARDALLATKALLAVKIKAARFTLRDAEGNLIFNSHAPVKALPTHAIIGTATHDMIVTEYGNNVRFQIEATVRNTQPIMPISPLELSRSLSAQLAAPTGTGVVLWGMLLDEAGRVIQSFPAGISPVVPLHVDEQGTWQKAAAAGLSGLTQLAIAPDPARRPWRIAAQIWLTDPTNGERLVHLLQENQAWVASLGLMLLLFCGGVYWQMRLPKSSPAAKHSSPLGTKTSSRPTASEATSLVRQPGYDATDEAKRSLIMAEITGSGDAARLRVQTQKATSPMPQRRADYCGSLARLHRLHRGASSAPGSQVLDHAPSPILRRLIQKIRPLAKTDPESLSPRARITIPRPPVRPPIIPPVDGEDTLRRLHEVENQTMTERTRHV